MRFSKKSWLVWVLAVLFFAFQFALRLFPGLVMKDIMGKFQIDATAFGFLSAAYYFGYAGMQIPVGLLLDRYHPRFVISGCVLVCALGTLSFVCSDHWALTLLGRFLIGAGSAGGFLGAVKIVRLFFPEKWFTGMIGLTFSAGLMGALYGGKPTSLLVEKMGWVDVSWTLAAVSLALSFGIFLFFPRMEIPQAEAQSEDSDAMSAWQSLRLIFKNRQILWVGIAGALLVGPLEGFADIWGISYLVSVYGFSKHEATLVTSCIYLGMLFGGPFLSYIAQKWNAYYKVTAFCGLFMALIFFSLLYATDGLSKPVLMTSMGLVGIFSCYQVVVFAIACKLVPSRLSGLATSVTNCINMTGGCLFHFVIGKIVDHRWTGMMEDGIRVYDAESYSAAITVIPIALFLGFLCFFLMKKTTELTPNQPMA